MVTAVREASFAIQPGELVGFMGESGSGKSTLLSIVGTLNIPYLTPCYPEYAAYAHRIMRVSDGMLK